METKLPKKGTGLCACHPFSVAGVFLGVTLPLIKGKPIARWGHKADGPVATGGWAAQGGYGKMKWGSYFVLAMVLLGMMVGQAGAQEIDLEGLLVSDFQVFGEELGDGAYVYQDGEWNVAELFQSSVDNKAFIVQEGNNNEAKQEQVGTGNWAGIRQNGNANRALISQNGNGNWAGIYQLGNENIASIQQTGNNNRAGIFQQGNSNNASIVQNGDNFRANVVQKGNNNSAKITQSGL
jgi:hypothetical protein